MKKMNTLTKVVGAMSLGALVGLVGCSKKEDDGDDGAPEVVTEGEDAAATTEGEGSESSCSGGDGSCGGEMDMDGK